MKARVRFDGEDLAPFKPHEIIFKGMSMVPEGRRIFARLTVAENLEMGAYTRKQGPEIATDLERVFTVSPSQGTP